MNITNFFLNQLEKCLKIEKLKSPENIYNF